MIDEITSKQKTIFISIFFLIGGIVSMIIFIENNCRYNRIFKDKFVCEAKVLDEQRDYMGGKPQTFKYTLEYSYNGEIYINDAPHTYEFGHFKKGQYVEIFLEKSNPYNFVVSKRSNQWPLFWISILFLVVSFLMYRYRETISKNVF